MKGVESVGGMGLMKVGDKGLTAEFQRGGDEEADDLAMGRAEGMKKGAEFRKFDILRKIAKVKSAAWDWGGSREGCRRG